MICPYKKEKGSDLTVTEFYHVPERDRDGKPILSYNVGIGNRSVFVFVWQISVKKDSMKRLRRKK